MQHSFFSALLLLGTTSLALANENAPRPVFSEAYTVANAVEAFREIDARWDVAQSEQQARFMAHEGDASSFKRTDPVLQQVSWPYDVCTDVASLVPPPLEGWGISSEAPFSELPVSEERAEVFYKWYDPEMTADDEGFFKSEKTVHLLITATSGATDFFSMALENEAMRNVMLAPGPYGYPMLKMQPGTVLGPYSVAVTGMSDDDPAAKALMTRIIGCAIKGGLIADGVDPASLKDTP